MDDKTINLWRQIENCRRRGRGQGAERSKPAAVPTRESVTSWRGTRSPAGAKGRTPAAGLRTLWSAAPPEPA